MLMIIDVCCCLVWLGPSRHSPPNSDDVCEQAPTHQHWEYRHALIYTLHKCSTQEKSLKNN